MRRHAAVILTFLTALAMPAAAQTFQQLIENGSAAAGGCWVHLVAAKQRHDITRPCGVRLSLTSADYDTWLEARGKITPFRTSTPGARDATYQLPLAQAGTVYPQFTEHAGTIELWHLEPREWHATRARAFHRVTTNGVDSDVQMPIGRALGISYNAKDEPLEISDPVTITAAQAAQIRPRPPPKGADLLVIINRPADLRSSSPESLSLDRDPRRSPDISVQTADHLLGVWYNIDPGRVGIALHSDSIRLDPVVATLRGGRSTVLRTTASRLPTLSVTVTAPPDAIGKDELTLRVDSSHGTVRTIPIELGIETPLISMPAEQLDVVLSLSEWRFRKPVDLSSGFDASINFALEPFVISGQVTYGGTPVAADVGFSAGHLYKTTTNADGYYKIVLWHPTRYAIQVNVVDHPEIPAYLDTTRINSSRTINFAIPRARYAVQVSEDTGHPIPSATITVTNDFIDDSGQRRIMSHVTTDAKGHTFLPPMRSGSLDLRVDAEGYRTREEHRTVSDSTGDVLIDVQLQRLVEPRTLHLTLPDGSPASGAELLVIAAQDQVMYSAAAAADGTVRLPKDISSGLLLARHPNAGAGVHFLGSTDDAAVDWRLPPAATQLNVRGLGADGKAAGQTLVFVWIAGYRIGGAALAFLARTSGMTSIESTWTGANLPAGPTRILLLKRSSDGRYPDPNAFEALAQPVDYP